MDVSALDRSHSALLALPGDRRHGRRSRLGTRAADLKMGVAAGVGRLMWHVRSVGTDVMVPFRGPVVRDHVMMRMRLGFARRIVKLKTNGFRKAKTEWIELSGGKQIPV